MARPKGALGKNKAFLLNRLKDMYGKDFDPIMKAAEQAHTLDKLAQEDPTVANQRDSIASWLKIAEYVAPKLKAVEHSTGDQGGLVISVNRKRYDGGTNDKD